MKTALNLARDFSIIVAAVIACGFIFAVMQHYGLEATPFNMGSVLVGAVAIALLLRKVEA